MRLGDAAPEWMAAPDGRVERTISGAAKIEIIIYQDAAFAYRLDSLTLAPCADCAAPAARPAQ